jgi:periplasmic protein CpxP/Spy
VFNNLKYGFAIAAISALVAGIAVPGFISAQNTSPNSPTNSPTNSPSLVRKNQGGKIWKELSLTDSQKQQIKSIREKTRQEVQSVFTVEQRTKLEAAGQSGDRKGVMRSLNLSDTQKQQMRDIRKKSQEQISAILTPEQRSKFEQLRSQRSGK